MKKKFSLTDFLCRFYVYILLFVMYAPILLLIVFSFTDTKIIGKWGGFSLHLYSALFKDAEIMQAFGNTFLVAISSAVVSTTGASVSASVVGASVTTSSLEATSLFTLVLSQDTAASITVKSASNKHKNLFIIITCYFRINPK